MGYYSNFIPVRELSIDVVNRLREVSEYFLEDNGEGCDIKWYDVEDDVETVSKEFPDVVIEYNISGESQNDMWTLWAKNGVVKTQRVSEATHPKFDDNGNPVVDKKEVITVIYTTENVPTTIESFTEQLTAEEVFKNWVVSDASEEEIEFTDDELDEFINDGIYESDTRNISIIILNSELNTN